jgi:hypothetical protein
MSASFWNIYNAILIDEPAHVVIARLIRAIQPGCPHETGNDERNG